MGQRAGLNTVAKNPWEVTDKGKIAPVPKELQHHDMSVCKHTLKTYGRVEV